MTEPWWTQAEVWSAVAAAGSLFTAIVIAVNGFKERQVLREHAFRTNLSVHVVRGNSKDGWLIRLQNDGPEVAQNIAVEVYRPQSETTSDAPSFRNKDTTTRIGVLPVGTTAFNSVIWPEGYKNKAGIGMEITWQELSKKTRSLPFTLSTKIVD